MPSLPIQLTVLGSGTSMGVPSLGCHCPVCSSTDPRDNRLRPSILLSRGSHNAVIDTTPDFRQQGLRAGLDRLDAVLLTHGHADHILGFDDIRPFNIRQKAPIPVYGLESTFEVLRRAFPYVFDGKPALSSVPQVSLHVVNAAPFDVLGIKFVPVPLVHGELEVLGYRFGRAAYLTDFSALPNSSADLLLGLDDLIIDALRDAPHPMHQTVEQALALIEKLKPRRAWFTHIAHDLPHAETSERLRKLGMDNVHLAYDGLQFQVQVEGEIDVQVEPKEASPAPRSARAIAPTSAIASAKTPVREFSNAQAWAAHYGPSGRGGILAIGNFDGIHLGHQALLRAAVQRGRETGGVATVLTFDPSPRKVLKPDSAPARLSTNAQRMAWMTTLGLEAAVVLPFTLELARLSPEDFVDSVLLRGLNVRAVLVGENFRFGHQQAGDVALLRELGMRKGFEVIVIPPVMHGSEVVSSTVIRRDIAAGNVADAARLLGRAFALSGPVATGTGTGRRFTFPTLNLVPDQEVLPARGVYITRTLIAGEAKSRRSVTNVGIRPTFNGQKLTVETHLLDFAGEVGASRIEVRFCKRLREEKKFSGPEELRKQIARDIAAARRYFERLRRFRASKQLA